MWRLRVGRCFWWTSRFGGGARALMRRSRRVRGCLVGSADGGLGVVGEFAQVAADRVEGEFALRSGEPAKAELSDVLFHFHLSGYGFYDCFAAGVVGSICFGA